VIYRPDAPPSSVPASRERAGSALCAPGDRHLALRVRLRGRARGQLLLLPAGLRRLLLPDADRL